MPSLQLPDKLLPFLERPKRFCILYGGRGSAKSYSVAALCLMAAQTEGIKTACYREFMNSIDDSVHSLLKQQIESMQLSGFEIQNNQILFGGEAAFKFRGLARNTESVKSMSGFNRFWIEEAQTISEESLRVITPTLREEGSQLWMTANPRSRNDPFSKRFLVPFEHELNKSGIYEDDLHLIIRVNWDDNPFFPEVLRQEMEYDRENTSTAMFRHVWEGDYYDSVEDALISVEWFEAAIDAHTKLGFKPEGPIIASHDPSDLGPDAKGYCLRQGSVILDVKEMITGDTNEGVDWAIDLARQRNADWFVWDGDGIGLGLRRQVMQSLDGSRINYEMFRGSEGAEDPMLYYGGDKGRTNKDTFLNRRAQYYWKLRDRFEATWRAVTKGEYIDPEELISISSDIEYLDQLRAEITRIPQKRSNNGKLQVLSKVDMKKKPYQIESPNMADAVMMSMFSPKTLNKQTVQINFSGWGK